jgi:hypothetical protein
MAGFRINQIYQLRYIVREDGNVSVADYVLKVGWHSRRAAPDNSHVRRRRLRCTSLSISVSYPLIHLLEVSGHAA